MNALSPIRAAQGTPLRPILLARLACAKAQADANGRGDLIAACDLKMSAVRRAFDNELPMYVDGVDDLIADIQSRRTMAEVSAHYRQVARGEA